VLVSDGRALMVAEWGDAGSFPVFWLHGSPDLRFSQHHDESEYSRAGARVITYDRPGYGASDRDPVDVSCPASEMLLRSPMRLAPSGSPRAAARSAAC
jgi:pimeloyl-ACP methyl ester carboxylesterase